MFIAFAGYISGILMLASFIPYIRDILRQKTKPERGSWLIWTAIGIIAFSSQLAKGASYSLALAGAQGLGDAVIFILSLRYGFGGLLRRDKAALVVAALGLLLWYITQEALIALFIVIAIDAAGGILTILKSYELPETETLSTWILTCLSGFFACIAVGDMDLILLIFPVYIFLVALAIILAMTLGRRREKRQRSTVSDEL